MVETLLAALHQPQTWLFFGIGFVAQLCDGSLGMGFGAISSTALAAIGLPRAVASASVNGAKLFTGAASGIAHLLHRNVDGRMLVTLAIAGGLGGYLGATVLAHYASRWVGIFTSSYLLLVGAYILSRAFREPPEAIRFHHVGGVGFAGGFLEALSGVWGPLVTSNLVAFGANPRHAIGSGNVAETFVAGVVFTVLVKHLGIAQLSVSVLGLLLGALVASPVAARLTREIPRRTLMIGVGILVMALSLLRLVRDLLS
ncbi:MAG: sulfite exporter TauE/SafE family protein [Steroidobacteraceae bacterium]